MTKSMTKSKVKKKKTTIDLVHVPKRGLVEDKKEKKNLNSQSISQG